jgi:hypothetical protein
MDFTATLTAFTCPQSWEVYEKEGAYINGYWQEEIVEESKREVQGILLEIDPTTLKLDDLGSIVESGYCAMFEKNQDFYSIPYSQNQQIQGKQTYWLIDGFEYRVVKNPVTSSNTNFSSYNAVRFRSNTND